MQWRGNSFALSFTCFCIKKSSLLPDFQLDVDTAIIKTATTPDMVAVEYNGSGGPS